MIFLELKQLTLELLPAVLELDQQCFGGLWTLEGYQRELNSSSSELLVIATTGADESENSWSSSSAMPMLPPVVGFSCLWSIVDEAHITIVAIHPRFQKQGLGQALLVALLQSAHQQGLERATLEVRISNQSAINLYKKFGFAEAGCRKRYYQDTGEDALILWRGGLQSSGFSGLLTRWQSEICNRLAQHRWRLTVSSDTVVGKKTFLTCL